jgi:hypothetical protein
MGELPGRRRAARIVAVVTVCAGIIALVAGLTARPLTRFVESDRFRAVLEKETAKGLHFPNAHFSPIRRTGALSAAADTFQADHGGKAMRTLNAANITGKFNSWGIFRRVRQLDYVHVGAGNVEIQTYTPQPEPSPVKPWFQKVFLPERVYLNQLTSDPVEGNMAFSRPASRFFRDPKEFKATGTIDAPTRVVNNVINDVEGYPSFMPFTAECRILQREGNSIYTYQRISPKIVGDRDYTLQVEETSWPANAGFAYLKHWKPANEAGPPEKKGVLRVKLCEGGWLLEPESAEKTRATYSIYTDTGGSLPAFIANAASGIGIRKIFAAVRHQAKDPKYRADKDVVEAGR